MDGSPSKCEYCGRGFYFETLDKKTGLDRDRFFEEGLVRFVAETAKAANVSFEWGSVAAENFTLGMFLGEDDYVELSFEKDDHGRGVYIFDLMPYEGHGGDDIHKGAWIGIVPAQGKNGMTVYRVEGGGLLRYTIGKFSSEDIRSLNLNSLLGKIIIGLVGR
jgi:hypothetical protein